MNRLLFLVVPMLTTVACADPAAPGEDVWTRRHDGPAGAADRALSALADGHGVIVAGWETDLTEDADLWLARYRADGSRDWVVREDAGPDAGVFASDLTWLPDGSLLMVGGLYSEEHDWDVWVRRMNPDLSTAWTRVMDGGSDLQDEAVAVAVDGQGNCVVAGFVMLAALDTDALIWGLTGDGKSRWTRTLAGVGGAVDAAIEVAMLSDGDIVAVGYATSELEGNDWDAWIRRIGPGGEERWAVDRPAPGGGRAQAVAAVGDGFVVGGFETTPGTAFDAWLARYDGDGNLIWERTDDGSGGFDALNDLAVTPQGTIVAVGYDFVDDEGLDAWVRHHRADGELLWSHDLQGTGRVFHENGTIRGADDVAAAVAIGADGHLYAAGSTTVLWDGDRWDVDAFVRKLAL